MVDPEITAAQERVAAEAPGEHVEVERAEVGETITEDAGEVTAAADAAEPEPKAQPAGDPVIADRLSRLERENAELRDQWTRLARPSQPVEDKPPVARVETMEDLEKLMAWREERLAARLSSAFREDAASVAAEQRARGIYNREAMGAGRDYDALVAKHIAPVEQVNPSFRRMFSASEDPATARYVLAAALEIIDRAKGDPARGLQNLWNALDGKQATTTTVLKQIQKAAETQVGRSNLRGARATEPGDARAELARDAKNMSTAAFAAKYPHLIGG